MATLLFTMCLNFCGVLATKDAMPGFWIFMYRCNPFIYLVQALLSTGLANTEVICSSYEYVSVNPPLGQSCDSFFSTYISQAGGYVVGNSDGSCSYCAMKSTNAFLISVNALYSERWRNFGIFVAFIAINIILTVFFYWLARVPKGTREKKHKK